MAEDPIIDEHSGTIVRPRPTRTQRAWWGYVAFFGAISVTGAIGIVYEMGPQEGLVPAILWPGILVSVGAFFSGKLLRQRRTALATVIAVSADGMLRVVDPEGEAAQSLVGARALFIDHGRSVDRMYRAEMPTSLASSGPYGALLVDRDDGRHVLVFAGELPVRDQKVLLSAAEPFLASTGAMPMVATPTPDEQSEHAPLGSKLRDFALLIAVILALALPAFAVGVIQLARRGDLDPNTLWLSVVICLGAVAVVIVRWVRAIRREGGDRLAPKNEKPPEPEGSSGFSSRKPAG